MFQVFLVKWTRHNWYEIAVYVECYNKIIAQKMIEEQYNIKKEDIKYIGEYLKKSEFENKYFLDGFNKDKYDSYIKSNGYVKTILKTY